MRRLNSSEKIVRRHSFNTRLEMLGLIVLAIILLLCEAFLTYQFQKAVVKEAVEEVINEKP